MFPWLNLYDSSHIKHLAKKSHNPDLKGFCDCSAYLLVDHLLKIQKCHSNELSSSLSSQVHNKLLVENSAFVALMHDNITKLGASPHGVRYSSSTIQVARVLEGKSNRSITTKQDLTSPNHNLHLTTNILRSCRGLKC